MNGSAYMFAVALELLTVATLTNGYNGLLSSCDMVKILRDSNSGGGGGGGRSRRSDTSSSAFQYAVVIDAGSSGTRVKVYQWPAVRDVLIEHSDIKMVQPTLKLSPGLSEHAKDFSSVRGHIRPLLENATGTVPVKAHRNTPVYFFATAGMRLLLEKRLNDVIRFIDSLLRNRLFCPFRYLGSHNTRVLSGEEEGVFAWIAANFAEGTFQGYGGGHPSATVGVLEMGGMSTQIAFAPTVDILDNKFTLRLGGSRYHLYVHSYLLYGQDGVDVALKEMLYADAQVSSDFNQTQELTYPCMLQGDVSIEEHNRTYVGTGDVEQCLELLQRYVYKENSWKCNPKPCAIGSTYQPSIPKDMKFYLLAAFRKTLQVIGAIDPTNGVYVPNYGMKKAVEFCQTPLADVEEMPGYNKHFNKLCLRALYIHKLITSGYGFPADTTNLVAAVETVERFKRYNPDWSLGAVIYENTAHECHLQSSSPSVHNVLYKLLLIACGVALFHLKVLELLPSLTFCDG